jgi:hypothetical protein
MLAAIRLSAWLAAAFAKKQQHSGVNAVLLLILSGRAFS